MTTTPAFDALPKTAYCEIEARRLAEASVVWTAPDTPIEIQRYAVASPLKEERGGNYTTSTVTLVADRYGGSGIAANGGSGRCGAIGHIQIKGIGRTPLASDKTQYSHAYGGATIREAIREVIWTGVIKRALPFGAVPVHGIIETGSEIQHPDRPITDPLIRRALTIRDVALRPAHFMRASHFQVPINLPSEECRMLEAIACLPRILIEIYGTDAVVPARGGFDITEAIVLMLSRFARQLAACFAKKIMHGGLSASNVAMDGRFLDFGMTTNVSDYGPIITSGRSPNMVNQPSRLFNTLEPLFFYIDKYGEKLALASTEELRKGFDEAYRAARRLEMLELTGISRSQLLTVPNGLLENLSSEIDAVWMARNEEPFKLLSACPKYQTTMPKTFGEYNLGEALKALATYITSEDPMKHLAMIGDRSLAKRITTAYRAVILRVQSGYSEGEQKALISGIQQQCERKNRSVEELYYHNLNAAMDKVIADDEDPKEMIDRISALCNHVYDDSYEQTTQASLNDSL